MLEWNSQLPFSTDVPTSSRLQLLPFCSRLLLEPANDPPCASYPTFSREPGMTSSRKELVLKRRLSGNIPQRAIPTFLQATGCEHKFYIVAEINVVVRIRTKWKATARFQGLAACLTGIHIISGRKARPTCLYYRAENFRKDGSAVFSQPNLLPPFFENDSSSIIIKTSERLYRSVQVQVVTNLQNLRLRTILSHRRIYAYKE